jgi:hypothetical protein
MLPIALLYYKLMNVWIFLALFCFVILPSSESWAGNQQINKFSLSNVNASALPKKRFVECPADLKRLTDLMLKDLPSYANRVIKRTQTINSTSTRYVIVAGRGEFEPLNLERGEYQPTFAESSQQIFFTTLEREYNRHNTNETQNYHWLFLTETNTGWKVVFMYSRLGSRDSSIPPTPSQESTNSAIGQAVNLWLRDCRAGKIRV